MNIRFLALYLPSWPTLPPMNRPVTQSRMTGKQRGAGMAQRESAGGRAATGGTRPVVADFFLENLLGIFVTVCEEGVEALETLDAYAAAGGARFLLATRLASRRLQGGTARARGGRLGEVGAAVQRHYTGRGMNTETTCRAYKGQWRFARPHLHHRRPVAA